MGSTSSQVGVCLPVVVRGRASSRLRHVVGSAVRTMCLALKCPVHGPSELSETTMPGAQQLLHKPAATPANAARRITPKTPVSVIVPVKNEAENLKRCLPALAWADEVFVVDSQSHDETAAVAAEHGATVVQFHYDGTYPKKKNWALDNLPFQNHWVLIVDADEVVVPELAQEIARRIKSDEAEGYYL